MDVDRPLRVRGPNPFGVGAGVGVGAQAIGWWWQQLAGDGGCVTYAVGLLLWPGRMVALPLVWRDQALSNQELWAVYAVAFLVNLVIYGLVGIWLVPLARGRHQQPSHVPAAVLSSLLVGWLAGSAGFFAWAWYLSGDPRFDLDRWFLDEAAVPLLMLGAAGAGVAGSWRLARGLTSPDKTRQDPEW